jgi:hypothetical protein
MTWLRGKDPHAAGLVAVPVRAHLQPIPGRSHAKRFFPCGRALYPVRAALLAAAYSGEARPGLTRAFVAEQGTGVWPPTGIAPAALLRRREHFGK